MVICCLCQESKSSNQFTKNKIDFIEICNVCFDKSNILDDIFNNLNFNSYWEYHINDQKYINNLQQLFSNIFEFFFKEITINQLIDLIKPSIICDFLDNIQESNVIEFMNLISKHLPDIEISDKKNIFKELLESDTLEAWDDYINYLISQVTDKDFNKLKIILQQDMIKEMLGDLIERAISLILKKNFGERNNLLSGISFKGIIKSFLSNSSDIIINSIKSDKNQSNIKSFIFTILNLLMKSNKSDYNLMDNLNSPSFLLLAKLITKIIHDKKLQNNIVIRINLILNNYKLENGTKSLDCVLNSNLINYNYSNIKNQFDLLLQENLSSIFSKSTLIKKFIQEEIKCYFEYYSITKK